jgi:hypothetical protein
MRSADMQEVALYSYISPEQRVPADHPLRPIRAMVNGVLRTLPPEVDKIYSINGRPSIHRSGCCAACRSKYFIRYVASA